MKRKADSTIEFSGELGVTAGGGEGALLTDLDITPIEQVWLEFWHEKPLEFWLDLLQTKDMLMHRY